jgi:hypothetical protein
MRIQILNTSGLFAAAAEVPGVYVIYANNQGD